MDCIACGEFRRRGRHDEIKITFLLVFLANMVFSICFKEQILEAKKPCAGERFECKR